MLLTVSVPYNFRLVVFHSGVNDHSAAQTQCLAFSAKGHFKFVKDGCSKGNAILMGETVCGEKTFKTLLD